jgi:hypothetical protein
LVIFIRSAALPLGGDGEWATARMSGTAGRRAWTRRAAGLAWAAVLACGAGPAALAGDLTVGAPFAETLAGPAGGAAAEAEAPGFRLQLTGRDPEAGLATSSFPTFVDDRQAVGGRLAYGGGFESLGLPPGLVTPWVQGERAWSGADDLMDSSATRLAIGVDVLAGPSTGLSFSAGTTQPDAEAAAGVSATAGLTLRF